MSDFPNASLPPPPPIPQGSGGYGYQQPPAGLVKTSGLSIASLVLGILSMLGFTILTGIPAVICGHMGLSAIGKSRGALKGGGLAVGGLVTGYLAIVIGAVLIIGMFPLYGKILNEMKLKSALKSGYQIHSALTAYAAEHDDKYPDSLDDLVKEEYLERSVLTNLPKDAPANFWEYLGKGLNVNGDDQAILLRSKVMGKSRIVSRVNGTIKIVSADSMESD